MPQALNNIAVIYHYQGEQAAEMGEMQRSEYLFKRAKEYWEQAIALSPFSYNEAYNWLKLTQKD